MTKNNIALPLAIAVMSALPATAGTSPQAVITGSVKQPVRILCEQSPEAAKMGRYLRDFLKARHCPATVVLKGTLMPGSQATQMVLATPGSLSSLAPKVSVPKFAKATRDEAYVLDARAGKTGSTLLLIGKSPAGLRAVAARFVCKLANDGKQLTISVGREQADPFIKRRLIFVGDPARRQVPFGSPFKDADYETWSEARIRAYPELFWQFGFNGLQAGEYRGYGSVPDSDMPRIRKALQTLYKGAGDYDLFRSMFIWGDCLFDEGVTYSWNNGTERKIMRLYQKDIARDFGPLIDHFIIHVGDPGGCSRDGCDLYKTPQDLTTSMLEQFRRYNPKMIGTLSTWANSYFWRKSPVKLDMSNYGPMFPDMVAQKEFNEPIPDGAKFMDDHFLPKDVGIAMNRSYNEQQADMIRSHNRPASIWSWYIGDNEMLNTYWFTMQHTDNMLSAMPDKAREQIDWETHDLCWHGWPNIISAYVGSQKLWNPHRPLIDIEREFCVASFGPQNAEAVLGLYHAVESGWTQPIPTPEKWGTPEHNAYLTHVLQKASTIKFPANWKPNFAFPVPAQKYVELLIARVKLIRAVSQAQLALDSLRKRHGITKSNRAQTLYFKAEDSRGGEVAAARNYEISMPLQPGHTLGVSFNAIRDFQKAGIVSFGNPGCGMTLSLYDKQGGKLLAQKVFASLPAEQWITLDTDQPAGGYYLEVSNPTGVPTGVYGSAVAKEGVTVYTDGKATPSEPAELMQLKRKLIEELPNLPIDPMWRMDRSIANPGFTVPTFAEMIERM
ncbi:MAG: hypothetical protein ACYC1M_10235 [Armatimonadota bacterium]